MKTIEIWAEGFNVSGNKQDARLLTKVEVSPNTNFKQACQIALAEEGPYNSNKNSFWGCKLFDNEQDARKSFG